MPPRFHSPGLLEAVAQSQENKAGVRAADVASDESVTHTTGVALVEVYYLR